MINLAKFLLKIVLFFWNFFLIRNFLFFKINLSLFIFIQLVFSIKFLNFFLLKLRPKMNYYKVNKKNFLYPFVSLNRYIISIWPFFPIFDFTTFWFNYEKKEYQPLLIVENYGNVSSIKYDLSEYPLWEFKIFNRKIKPLLDKFQGISLEPPVEFINKFFKFLYFDPNPFFSFKPIFQNIFSTCTLNFYFYSLLSNILLILKVPKFLLIKGILNCLLIFYSNLFSLEILFFRFLKCIIIYILQIIWLFSWFFRRNYTNFLIYLENKNLLLTDKKLWKLFLFYLRNKNNFHSFLSYCVYYFNYLTKLFFYLLFSVLEYLFPSTLYYIRNGSLKLFLISLGLFTDKNPFKKFKKFIYSFKFFS
jgi:hypothetical protein